MQYFNSSWMATVGYIVYVLHWYNGMVYHFCDHVKTAEIRYCVND